MEKLKNLMILLMVNVSLYAVDIFEEFKNRVQQQYIDPFTKDLTGIVCSNSINTADSLGLFKAVPPSIGLDLSASFVLKEISSENIILNEAFKEQDFKYIPFFSLQISKGLPLNIDLIGRIFSYSNVIFYGAGVKYRFLSFPPIVPVVNCAVGLFYNVIDAKDILKHNSYSINAVISVDKLPFIRPYMVVGLDNGELTVYEAIGIGEIKSRFKNGLRYEVGFRLSFVPFVYISLGYLNVYSVNGYTLNLGLKF
ncbi:MAG: DUF6588 family protein [Endomicrobiia bacterium]